MRTRLRELWAYREILLNLVRKELKVKYTASVLGAVWSILNPIVFLAVFSFVTRVLQNQIPDFPVFLLSGLLAWNLFSAALLQGSRSVIDNANLVKKVAFPREILPLSAIGVALVDFVIQSAVLLLFILVSGHGLGPAALVLYPLSILTVLVFTVALVFWVVGAERALPRRRPPPEPRPAGLVLDDADRVPGGPRAELLHEPRHRRACGTSTC